MLVLSVWLFWPVKNSPSSLSFADGSVVELSPDSVVRRIDEYTQQGVYVERGSVSCRVAPQDANREFIVRSGEDQVTVRGTHFAVHRGTGFGVQVFEGSVTVTDGTLLEAGQQWFHGIQASG